MKIRTCLFIDDIKNDFNLFITSMISGAFVALSIMLYFIKNSLAVYVPISDFSDHVLSQGTMHNIDINARVSQYYNYLAGWFLLTMVFSIVLFYLLNKNKYKNKIEIDFLKDLSLISLFSLLVTLLLNYEFSQIILVLLPLSIPFYLMIIDIVIFKKNKDFDMMLLASSISLVVSIFFFVFLKRFGFSGIKLSIVYSGLTFIFALAVFIVLNSKLLKYKDKITVALIPLLFTSVVQCVLLECLNIINKRFDIVLNIQYKMYIVLIILAIALFILMFFTTKKKNSSKLIYSLFLPVTVLSFALVIAQPDIYAYVGADFFESANHEISIYQLFNHGSIPIIETFDAHMLSNQLLGYIYTLINGYEVWASTIYNTLFIALCFMLTYYLVSQMISRKLGFFFVLGFPILGMIFYHMFIYSAIMYFVMLKLINDDSFKNRILLCVVCFALCIFRLDVGYASVLSVIITYVGFNISKHRYENIFKLFITGAVSIFIVFAVYSILCIVNDINILTRTKEMLYAISSSQNWGYANVGDKKSVVYNLLLFVLPIVIMIVVSLTIFRAVIFKPNSGYRGKSLLMIVFFCAFYLLNLSRGLVRHSFVENGNAWYILSTVFIVILSYSCLKSKKNIEKFCINLAICVMVLGVAYPSFNDEARPLIHANYANKSMVCLATESHNYIKQYDEKAPLNGSRVYGEQNEQALELKVMLDKILTDEQSYIDVASLNTFYAITERYSPTYVNQFPMMINGDFMQDTAIESFEKQDLPIAILPIGTDYDIGFGSAIDGVYIDYKYYKIFEYIYSKYVPLLKFDNFYVYCLSEKYNEYLEELWHEYEIISTQTYVETKKLSEMAILWGEKDGNESIKDAPKLDKPISQTQYVISNRSPENKKPMNLILNIKASSNATGLVRLIACNTNVGEFSFYIKDGLHTYSIRVSSDYNYWEDITDAIVFESDVPIDVVKMCLMDDEGNYYTILE